MSLVAHIAKNISALASSLDTQIAAFLKTRDPMALHALVQNVAAARRRCEDLHLALERGLDFKMRRRLSHNPLAWIWPSTTLVQHVQFMMTTHLPKALESCELLSQDTTGDAHMLEEIQHHLATMKQESERVRKRLEVK